jgi:hypothetical protein
MTTQAPDTSTEVLLWRDFFKPPEFEGPSSSSASSPQPQSQDLLDLSPSLIQLSDNDKLKYFNSRLPQREMQPGRGWTPKELKVLKNLPPVPRPVSKNLGMVLSRILGLERRSWNSIYRMQSKIAGKSTARLRAPPRAELAGRKWTKKEIQILQSIESIPRPRGLGKLLCTIPGLERRTWDSVYTKKRRAAKWGTNEPPALSETAAAEQLETEPQTPPAESGAARTPHSTSPHEIPIKLKVINKWTKESKKRFFVRMRISRVLQSSSVRSLDWSDGHGKLVIERSVC